MSTITASAPAKIILFGEHAVVYGEPAIAVPVSSVRATATFTPGGSGFYIEAPNLTKRLPVSIDTETVEDALSLTVKLVLDHLNTPLPDVTITLNSNIPMAAGLGSGAAVSTALARSVVAGIDGTISNQALNDIIYQVEKLHHGTPSGIDNTVIVYEEPVYFVKGAPIETVRVAKPFTLIIADTGQPAPTHLSVGDVRKLYETEIDRIRPIIQAIGHLVQQARKMIESGNVEQLGALMTQNHKLLQQLTVSSPELDTLVDAALVAGAAGAKLSGGGRGGNMIALVTPDCTENVKKSLLDANATRVITTEVR